MPRSDDERMRSYILGADSNPDEPVWIAPDPLKWTTSNDPHFILLSPVHDRSAALLRLYCFNFRVVFGDLGVLPNPVGIVCEIDGCGMRIATDEEITSFLEQTKDVVFSRPWFKLREMLTMTLVPFAGDVYPCVSEVARPASCCWRTGLSVIVTGFFSCACKSKVRAEMDR